MERPGKGMTTYLDLRTKISNKKQKEKFYITDITEQDFSNFIKNFRIHLIYVTRLNSFVMDQPRLTSS